MSSSPPPPPTQKNPKILTLALSGPSTSGKSTISYLLHSLFTREPPLTPTPPLHILADDFMLDDPFLPRSRTGRFLDAETVNSIDVKGLIATIRYVQDPSLSGGQGISMPPHFLSWQTLDFDKLRWDAGELAGGDEAVGQLRKGLEQLIGAPVLDCLRSGDIRIVILDGFLLYHSPLLRELCDLKILLRLSKAEAKRRRGLKPGYWNNRSPSDKDGMGNLVGLGPEFGKVDFWRLEEYFEECVWHGWESGVGWLFEDGDVEGKVRRDGGDESIVVGDVDLGPDEQAEWVVDVVGSWVGGVLDGKGEGVEKG
jgi:nicotinamide/nicotinate riboside kinase